MFFLLTDPGPEGFATWFKATRAFMFLEIFLNCGSSLFIGIGLLKKSKILSTTGIICAFIGGNMLRIIPLVSPPQVLQFNAGNWNDTNKFAITLEQFEKKTAI